MTLSKQLDLEHTKLKRFCPGMKLNQTVRNVTLIEVKRAARKIVRGGHITLTATYQEPGCPQTTTYEFVVVLGIDGQYNLVRSTYLPTTVTPPSSKNVCWISLGHELDGHHCPSATLACLQH